MIRKRKNTPECAQLQEKYLAALKEKEELEYQLAMIKEKMTYVQSQETEIKELHQNTRKLKHDMKNHLMVIASYMNGMDYESAKIYVSDILDELNSMHSYIETGNSLMNHILNDKLAVARQQGMTVKAEIENLSFSRLKSIDFSAILSNLLDNAIEAGMREKAPELEIIIAKRKGYETICVKNKITVSVLEANPFLQSTKTDKSAHGIGIPQVKRIVDACGGMYDFYEEDNFFCANVFIPQ